MKQKVCLIAHFGEDFIRYRINFLNYLKSFSYDVFAIVPDDKYKSEIIKTGIKYYFYKYKKSWVAIFYLFTTVFYFVYVNFEPPPEKNF
jgi:hypothetical protein